MSKVLVDGIPAKRLSEICRAEQEGRLVILPCKVGDTVYKKWSDSIEEHVIKRIDVNYFSKSHDRESYLSVCGMTLNAMLGKDMHLTREAAEQALEKEKTAPGAATPESGTGK